MSAGSSRQTAAAAIAVTAGRLAHMLGPACLADRCSTRLFSTMGQCILSGELAPLQHCHSAGLPAVWLGPANLYLSLNELA